MVVKYILASVALSALTVAQSCGPKPSGGIQPSLASGYQMQVVATGLAKPRGIAFDSAGNLLVVQGGAGLVSAHALKEENGCMSVTESRNLTSNMMLNHGIEMSSDGNTLYVSSTEAAYSFAYNSMNRSVSNQKTLVTNMTTQDHTTRTLLLSRKVPGMLLISRGSTSNIDFEATMLSSGHSTVKAFNLNATNGTAYNYNNDGDLLGWGLRNEVGIAESPINGGVWGVENSADQLNRSSIDIHEDNPAEKLNFLGYLNGTRGPNQGMNFGYPWCFAAWNVSPLPNNGNLSVGSQFAVDASADSNDQNKTDEYCAAQAPPRLVFQSHMAPLDIKFNDSGREAWVAFHGSWNRDQPSGYKLSTVAFKDNGDPVEAANSTKAATDIVKNMDNSKCPDDCFRPVAMAIDKQGRVFFSSDYSGEVYMVSKAANGSSGGSSGSSGGSGGSGGTSAGARYLPSAASLSLCTAFVLAAILI